MANATVSDFNFSRKKLSISKKTSKNTFGNRESSRVERLKPLVLDEVLSKFAHSDYFTRDHLLYFSSLRQFSMAYKISLVREIVNHFISIGTLLRLNKIDLCISTPFNLRRSKTARKNKEVSYSGSYTTRSADELLMRRDSIKQFTINELAKWLDCLDKLTPSTQQNYAKRICDDLLRRNILIRGDDNTFILNN